MGMISYKYKNSRTVNATEIFNVAFKNAFENAAKLETFIPDLPSKIFDWLPVPVQRSPIIESRKRIGHFYAQVNSRSIHVLFCATAATFKTGTSFSIRKLRYLVGDFGTLFKD